jgi:hypothetical protein
MAFNLQTDVRCMAHKLGMPCEGFIPDSSMDLSQRKRILEHSVECLRTMLAEKKDSSGMNRIPSSDQNPEQGDAGEPPKNAGEPPAKKPRIASTKKPSITLPELQFRKLIETDKFIDIPAECLAKCKAKCKDPNVNLAAEIQSGRADYSPQYFISWSGNYIMHCALGLPRTRGCMGKRFLIHQFAQHHGGTAGKTSRVLGPYSDCVIDYDQLIQAAQATWPDILTDDAIKQLQHCRSAAMRQKRQSDVGSKSNPLRGGGGGAGATPPGGSGGGGGGAGATGGRGNGRSSGKGDSGGEGRGNGGSSGDGDSGGEGDSGGGEGGENAGGGGGGGGEGGEDGPQSVAGEGGENAGGGRGGAGGETAGRPAVAAQRNGGGGSDVGGGVACVSSTAGILAAAAAMQQHLHRGVWICAPHSPHAKNDPGPKQHQGARIFSVSGV